MVELKELREAAKRNNVDAIRAIIQYEFEECNIGLRSTKEDHRYFQGACDMAERILLSITADQRDM